MGLAAAVSPPGSEAATLRLLGRTILGAARPHRAPTRAMSTTGPGILRVAIRAPGRTTAATRDGMPGAADRTTTRSKPLLGWERDRGSACGRAGCPDAEQAGEQ